MISIAVAFVVASIANNAVEKRSSSLEARRILHNFALCTVRTNRKLSSTAVIEDWSAAMMVKANLISAECLDFGTLLAESGSMNAALGEVLATSEKDELSPAEVASAPALSLREFDSEYASNGGPASELPAADHRQQLENFRLSVLTAKLGECMIHVDAAGARFLLSTKVGSNAEVAAAQRLKPAMTTCSSPEQALTFSAETVRKAVGMTYFRMEMSARGVRWRAAASEVSQ